MRSPSGTVFMMVGYQGPDMGEPVEDEQRRFLAEEEARLAALRAEKEAREAKAAQVTDSLRAHVCMFVRVVC